MCLSWLKSDVQPPTHPLPPLCSPSTACSITLNALWTEPQRPLLSSAHGPRYYNMIISLYYFNYFNLLILFWWGYYFTSGSAWTLSSLFISFLFFQEHRLLWFCIHPFTYPSIIINPGNSLSHKEKLTCWHRENPQKHREKKPTQTHEELTLMDVLHFFYPL